MRRAGDFADTLAQSRRSFGASGVNIVFKNAQKPTGAYSINCFRLRWIIMSCTEPIVILSRLVSVAFVKCP